MNHSMRNLRYAVVIFALLIERSDTHQINFIRNDGISKRCEFHRDVATNVTTTLPATSKFLHEPACGFEVCEAGDQLYETVGTCRRNDSASTFCSGWNASNWQVFNGSRCLNGTGNCAGVRFLGSSSFLSTRTLCSSPSHQDSLHFNFYFRDSSSPLIVFEVHIRSGAGQSCFWSLPYNIPGWHTADIIIPASFVNYTIAFETKAVVKGDTNVAVAIDNVEILPTQNRTCHQDSAGTSQLSQTVPPSSTSVSSTESSQSSHRLSSLTTQRTNSQRTTETSTPVAAMTDSQLLPSVIVPSTSPEALESVPHLTSRSSEGVRATTTTRKASVPATASIVSSSVPPPTTLLTSSSPALLNTSTPDTAATTSAAVSATMTITPEPSVTLTTTSQSTLQPSVALTTTSQSTLQPSVTLTTTSQSTLQPPVALTTTSQSTLQPSLTLTTTNQSTLQPSVTLATTSQSTLQPSVTLTTTGQSTLQQSVTLTTTNQSTLQPSLTLTTTNQSTLQPSVTLTTTSQSTLQPSVTLTTTSQSTLQPSLLSPATTITTESTALSQKSTTTNITYVTTSAAVPATSSLKATSPAVMNKSTSMPSEIGTTSGAVPATSSENNTTTTAGTSTLRSIQTITTTNATTAAPLPINTLTNTSTAALQTTATAGTVSDASMTSDVISALTPPKPTAHPSVSTTSARQEQMSVIGNLASAATSSLPTEAASVTGDPATERPSPTSHTSLQLAEVVGIIVGCLAAVVLVFVLLCCKVRRHSRHADLKLENIKLASFKRDKHLEAGLYKYIPEVFLSPFRPESSSRPRYFDLDSQSPSIVPITPFSHVAHSNSDNPGTGLSTFNKDEEKKHNKNDVKTSVIRTVDDVTTSIIRTVDEETREECIIEIMLDKSTPGDENEAERSVARLSESPHKEHHHLLSTVTAASNKDNPGTTFSTFKKDEEKELSENDPTASVICTVYDPTASVICTVYEETKEACVTENMLDTSSSSDENEDENSLARVSDSPHREHHQTLDPDYASIPADDSDNSSRADHLPVPSHLLPYAPPLVNYAQFLSEDSHSPTSFPDLIDDSLFDVYSCVNKQTGHCQQDTAEEILLLEPSLVELDEGYNTPTPITPSLSGRSLDSGGTTRSTNSRVFFYEDLQEGGGQYGLRPMTEADDDGHYIGLGFDPSSEKYLRPDVTYHS